jgi:AcrR family transcriptional regulator
MASFDRRERERLQTRTKILDAARDLFARVGYENVSLRQIADAIEYTPAAIYVHFADKESLFRELASADFRALAHVMPAAARVADPLCRIVKVGRAYIDFGLRHPNHYRLMFMTAQTAACAAKLDAAAKGHHGNPAEDAYAFLRACGVEAIGKGLVRAELAEPDLLAQTMWAGVHGLTSLQITMGTDPWVDWQPVERRTRAMVWTLVRGVAADPAAYPPGGESDDDGGDGDVGNGDAGAGSRPAGVTP